MNNLIRSTLVLMIVCIIAAVLLGFTYDFTYEKINEQGVIALNDNLNQIFPEAENFEEKDTNIYTALKSDEVIGSIVLVESQGYSSIIKILVGIDNDNKISAIRILDQLETPGLGDNAKKPVFYEQFSGLAKDQVALKENGGEIDAITGATVTTSAVITGVKSAFTDSNSIDNNNNNNNNSVDDNSVDDNSVDDNSVDDMTHATPDSNTGATSEVKTE